MPPNWMIEIVFKHVPQTLPHPIIGQTNRESRPRTQTIGWISFAGRGALHFSRKVKLQMAYSSLISALNIVLIFYYLQFHK